MKPTISVIVPVYKVEKYLEECIKSLVNQTYQNFEIILVDDGSPDRCPKICDLWMEKDSRIKVIHNRNQGVSNARNMGLDMAEGEYIAFCDADDQYEKDYLLKMQEAALDNNADIVICNYSVFNEKYEKVICDRKSGEIDKREVYRCIFANNTIGGFVWNKLFRRSFLSDIKFDENMQICEDSYFVCTYLRKINKIYYLGNSLYLYRLHTDSTMSNIRNMFDVSGNLKFVMVYEKMLREGIIENEYARYVKEDECILAIGAKCDYLNSKERIDKNIIKNLNAIIKQNIYLLLSSKNYTLSKKIVCIGNALFNFRKLKNMFR